ncbi:MAG: (Fe-S)-binding protein [Gammaproteobacteria bacterium]|nr:(Fe-S)-binding protein [Gammaproteobacteria bacterium]
MIEPGHEPQTVTRILFQDFPTWMMVTFYIAAIAAIIAFGYGCYVQLRKYRRGQALSLRNISEGLTCMIGDLLSHRSLKRRDHSAGMIHALIFFGFALLFIGTATITLEYDILEPITGWRFWYGSLYLWFSLIVDIAGLAFVTGLIYMMYRRQWLALPKLDYQRPDREPSEPDFDRSWYRREDWLFLWTLVLIGVTGFLLEADRLVWLQQDATVWNYRWWSPVGAVLAGLLEAIGLTSTVAESLRYGLWWLHGLLAFSFIGVLPFTKAKHIFTAMASLAIRDAKPAARLPEADLEANTIGYRKITDFNWKQLLHVDACTKCGRCHEACPANTSGFPLSPRDVVLTLRELANNSLQYGTLPAVESLQAVGDGINQVRVETLWSCRTCAACVEICPVGIEHVPLIVEMRRALVDEGEMDPAVQTALQNIQKKGNSIGENKRKRAAWSKKLDFEIRDARKEPVELLWFVGDYASFDPRYQKVAQTFARILHTSGIDFGILYEGEMTAGNDVRRVGEEGLFEHVAEKNIETLSGCEFECIVTTDPHSFNTLTNEYPQFGGEFKVEHATQLLNRLLASGKIPLERRLDRKVTYHDSCHLGRLNKEYAAPRDVLAKLGVKITEMPRNRDNAFCCGAGGGRIWTPDPLEMEKPAELRMHEAAEINDIDAFVVNCPKCMNMFEDAVKSTGNDKRLEVIEVIELVAACMDLDKVIPAAQENMEAESV